jgi:hypothetical protein
VANYGWDIVPADVAMPISGGTVNSAAFSVPRGAFSMAIHTPTAFDGGATVKLQSLDPNDDQTTEAWRDVQWVNLADGTFIAADQIPQNKVTTIPVTATGGGVLRFVASGDQSGAASVIKVAFLVA